MTPAQTQELKRLVRDVDDASMFGRWFVVEDYIDTLVASAVAEEREQIARQFDYLTDVAAAIRARKANG